MCAVGSPPAKPYRPRSAPRAPWPWPRGSGALSLFVTFAFSKVSSCKVKPQRCKPLAPAVDAGSGLWPSLILALLMLVVAVALPLQQRSLALATQKIFHRIIDTASFPLLGVGLLRFATFLKPSPDLFTERREALAWLGVVSLFCWPSGRLPTWSVASSARGNSPTARRLEGPSHP
jgi:hypothetical protein